MIKAQDAISAARALIGTPYSELDCINLIKRVIRTAPGGIPAHGASYTLRPASGSDKEDCYE